MRLFLSISRTEKVLSLYSQTRVPDENHATFYGGNASAIGVPPHVARYVRDYGRDYVTQIV